MMHNNSPDIPCFSGSGSWMGIWKTIKQTNKTTTIKENTQKKNSNNTKRMKINGIRWLYFIQDNGRMLFSKLFSLGVSHHPPTRPHTATIAMNDHIIKNYVRFEMVNCNIAIHSRTFQLYFSRSSRRYMSLCRSASRTTWYVSTDTYVQTQSICLFARFAIWQKCNIISIQCFIAKNEIFGRCLQQQRLQCKINEFFIRSSDAVVVVETCENEQ